MSSDDESMVGGMIGDLLSRIHEDMADELAAYEEELQRDPVLFTETNAYWIDFFYRECSNYKKALSYAHALPVIKQQLFRYAEDEIYEIRQCVFAFDGIAGSLQQTGQIDQAIACYQEGIQICEVLYTRDQNTWWYDYDKALGGLYIAYLNEGKLETALPLIHQCIGLYEQHHKNSDHTWVTDEYRDRYEDLFYTLVQLGNTDELDHYFKVARALFELS